MRGMRFVASFPVILAFKDKATPPPPPPPPPPPRPSRFRKGGAGFATKQEIIVTEITEQATIYGRWKPRIHRIDRAILTLNELLMSLAEASASTEPGHFIHSCVLQCLLCS